MLDNRDGNLSRAMTRDFTSDSPLKDLRLELDLKFGTRKFHVIIVSHLNLFHSFQSFQCIDARVINFGKSNKASIMFLYIVLR